MSEWTTLSLKQETKDALNEQRNESWDEFLQKRVETESTTETVEATVDTAHIEDQLDRIEEMLKDQSAVSQQQTVLNRLDDLQTELETKIEREIRG